MKKFTHVTVFLCCCCTLFGQTILPDTAQLALWLRADSGVTLLNGGDSVSQWTDWSGHGNSTTGPATPDSMPIWIAHDSILNNLPAISFNQSLSANRQEFYGTYIPNLFDSSVTIFVVNAGYLTNALYTNGIFSVGTLTGGLTLHRFTYSGYSCARFLNNYSGLNSELYSPTGSMPTAGYNYAVWSVEKNLYNSAGLYTNNTLDESLANAGIDGVISTPAGTPYLIGNSYNAGIAGFNNLNGKIAEIIVYTTALDSADRQQVLNYLYNKYAPQVNLGPDTVTTSLCPVVLNAGNRFLSYRWSTGDSVHSQIAVTKSGAYSVTTTDVFGRVSADTINVTVPFKGTSPVDTTICYGRTAVLKQLITNPALYTYTWSTGATADSVIVNAPGKYTCSIYDGTCHIYDTIPVKMDSLGLVSLLPATSRICGGTSPVLNDAGYNVVSYLWSPGGSTLAAPPLNASGIYTVTITDINSCSVSGSTNVTLYGHAPVANFSIANVCYTYPTNFTNLSTPVNLDSIASISWAFPTATPGSSTIQTPVVTYPNPVQVTATLLVTTDSGCTASKTDTFLIHKNPIAQFSGSPGCTNNSYQFINQSSSPSGDGFSGWLWNFGDGNTDTTKNPLHQYAANGTYTVSLTVTDSAGCSNTSIQNISLSLIIPLVPATTVLPGNNAVFQNNNIFFAWNTVPGATSYNIEIDSEPGFPSPWFYNGITGTNYTVDSLPAGTTYYWQLVANNLCGGVTYSQTESFSIFNPAISQCMLLWFRADSVVLVSPTVDSVKTWKDVSGNGNSTVGPNTQDSMPGWIAHEPLLNNMPSINFNHSTANDLQEFYGTTIAGLNNNFNTSFTTFIVASGYDVTPLSPNLYRDGLLTFGGIQTGMWLTRSLYQQTYGFLNNYSGNTTELISGVGTLPNTGFQYTLFGMEKNFGVSASIYANGALSATSTDPVISGSFTNGQYFIGNTFNSSIDGFYNLHGRIAEILVYTCALTDAQRQQVQNYIYTRYAPPVYLGPDTTQHSLCAVTLNAGNRFVAYRWSTGDSLHYEINVNRAGAYSVTVTDVFGNTSSSTINVAFPFEGTSPADTTICLGQSAVLRQLLTNPSSYTYSWSTGGTADSIIVNAPGKYICNLYDGTCHLLDTITVKVDSFKLISLLKPDTLICGGSSPALNLQGYTPVSYLWSPGDSTSATPAFNTPGAYSVTVTDINGCTATGADTLTFHAHAPYANFNITNFCYGSTTVFTNLDTIEPGDSINYIFWHIPGANPDTSTALSPVVIYTAVGPEAVTLFISTDSGCTASKTDSLFINKAPQASFTYTSNNSVLNLAYILCAGDNTFATFSDHTIAGFSTDSLISRVWAINGVIDSSTLSDSVILYPLPNQGIYNVMLAVENEKGCVDTLVQQVQVYAPLDADFSYSNICLSDTTQFLDQTHSYSIVTWDWGFGDGSNDNYTENPSHQYVAPNTYIVSLTVVNAIGCESFVTHNVTIVDTPGAYFTGSFACQQELYAPLDSSITAANDSIVQWNWLIGGNTYNIRNPQLLVPAGVSSFESKLVITTLDGCTDSIIKVLPVYPSPVASFNYTPLYGSTPITINFNNTSTGAASYSWDFGDSSSATSTDPSPSYEYTENGVYNITLQAINSYGCIDSVIRTLTLAPTDLDIAVDNVYVKQFPQPDGTVLMEVIVFASNQASRLITSAQFKVTLGSGGTFVQNWSGYLSSGQGMFDTIPVNFDVVAASANSFVCVVAQDVNNGQTEINYANNEICISLTGTMQLSGPAPNPAVTQSVLGIIMPQAGAVTIDILDELGQYVVKNHSLNLPAGRTDYQIPVAQLTGSEYYIRVTYNSDVEIRKLITR